MYHECIGKTILPQGLYTRKRNSGLRRQRKAEGGRGYQLFPHPRHKQLARVKPEKRELFEQRHSRELILYDAAARYLKELKASGEELSPKEWWREIDLLTAQKQVDSIDMKAMREELKAVERLRKAADQLARQEQDKPRDRGPER